MNAARAGLFLLTVPVWVAVSKFGAEVPTETLGLIALRAMPATAR